MLSFSESMKHHMKKTIKKLVGSENARQAAALLTGRK